MMRPAEYLDIKSNKFTLNIKKYNRKITNEAF